MEQQLKVEQDWNNDGYLRITGAKTIARYNKLKQQQSELPVNEYGVFFAFSQEQFDEGYKSLVDRGLIQDGEKIKRFECGAFGILDGMKRWMQEANAIDDKIRQECDPYEVYLDEYNNYECCIDWDGDQRAVERVVALFGLERAIEALDGRRYRAIERIADIAEEMKKN